MTAGNTIQPGGEAAQLYGTGSADVHAPAGLGDILERVLDKGLVIAGDIQVNLLDIELLTIKLRLVIASLETAKEVGIDWWQSDPWLNADAARRAEERGLHGSDHRSDRTLQRAGKELQAENRELRARIRELESGGNGAGK